jgi:hypothetical protein
MILLFLSIYLFTKFGKNKTIIYYEQGFNMYYPFCLFNIL